MYMITKKNCIWLKINIFFLHTPVARNMFNVKYKVVSPYPLSYSMDTGLPLPRINAVGA